MNIKNISLIACPAGLAFLATGMAADPPQAEIGNSQIRAKLHLPNPVSGCDRATRFDGPGVISSLTHKSHDYFGQWFEKYDPQIHDSIMGPVQKCVNPLGCDKDEACGSFMRIGVGVLRKPAAPPARGDRW